MTSELDIYRTANLLLKQCGADGAWMHAAMRADELLEAGDMDGRRVWQRVLGRDLLDVLSPRKASRGTRALKSAVNRRRVVIVVFLHSLGSLSNFLGRLVSV